MLTLNKNAENKIPLILLAGWAGSLLLSIFFTPLSIFLKGGVIVSLIFRLAIGASLYYIYQFYYGKRELSQRSYENLLMYIGYALVFTYVFSMLPQVVSDYYQLNLWKGSPFYVIWIIFTTAWPAALWLWMNWDKTRIAMGTYTQKEAKQRKETLKDKKKKKEMQQKRRKERGLAGNFWAEWVEPLFGAVIWVLIINHFVLQLFQIPSESMVPTFLVGDRVLVGKSFNSPNIPLTTYKLPRLSVPQEGEVTVFSSPGTEDPESDLYYSSVFSRVFHTFVYMITFTTVDIDPDINGDPKARLLVKRNIAGPGEKLCIVNDQVYKIEEGGVWTPMSEIPGQREYGQVELFTSRNPNQWVQRETPYTRQIVEEAISLVNSQDYSTLEEQLEQTKLELLRLIDQGNSLDWDHFEDAMNSEFQQRQDQFRDIMELSGYMIRLNHPSLKNLSMDQKTLIEQRFVEELASYGDFILNKEARDLALFLQLEDQAEGFLSSQIETTVNPHDGLNPYQDFMHRLNSLYKLKRMEFYIAILQNDLQLDEEILADHQELYKLIVYVDGVGYIRPFDMANMPEYPQGEGNFIPYEEYFLMGDNRYNSVDSRMGRVPNLVYVDEMDQSKFALQAEVTWDPHTIPLRLIHGKVRLILFPFDRMRLFQ